MPYKSKERLPSKPTESLRRDSVGGNSLMPPPLQLFGGFDSLLGQILTPNSESGFPNRFKILIENRQNSNRTVNMGQFITNPQFLFLNPLMQDALNYLTKTWSIKIDKWGENILKGGDSEARKIDDEPQWVSEFTKKLIVLNPDSANFDKPFKDEAFDNEKAKNTSSDMKVRDKWDENAELAQALLDAYYNYWTLHMNILHPESDSDGLTSAGATANLQELFQRTGASTTNKRTRILGDIEAGAGNIHQGDTKKVDNVGYCTQASGNALIISLFKKGYCLNPNKMLIPKAQEKSNRALVFQKFNASLNMQNAEIEKWKKGTTNGKKRQAGSQEINQTHLRPGDMVPLWTSSRSDSSVKGGGHFATVVKEINFNPNAAAGEKMSDLYYASGNSKGSSARVEKVERVRFQDDAKDKMTGNQVMVRGAVKASMLDANRIALEGDLINPYQSQESQDSERKKIRDKYGVKPLPGGKTIFDLFPGVFEYAENSGGYSNQ